ncbi:MAG: polysaccharide biosynthesis/export family protein [Gemmatimonadetes bacterium]|nr:polysaccharide biosynthesis/export family protein [Gemmatimonadota bacterium]
MLRTPKSRALAALLVIAAAAGCGRAAPPAALTPATTSADTTVSPLAVRAGDVVKVQVWGHTDLSGEFPVDENYNLLYPIVGEINVRQLTVGQLRDRLRDELGRLITQPFVTIIPLFRVAVLGEVSRPGLYSVDATMTIIDVLAQAGGPTRSANDRRMRLVRSGSAIPISLAPSTLARATLRELGVRSGDQLYVPRLRFAREDVGLFVAMLNLALTTYTVFR